MKLITICLGAITLYILFLIHNYIVTYFDDVLIVVSIELSILFLSIIAYFGIKDNK